jgi:hypothetical protein
MFQFRKVLALAFALVLCTGFTRFSHACPFERAHYVYSANSNISLSFRDVGEHRGWGSSLALDIRDKTSKRNFWFLFDQGSAHDINMISTTDVTVPNWTPPGDDNKERPLGEMHFFAWSKRMVFFQDMPQKGLKAPENISLPDLSEALWYRAEPRLSVAHGIFVFQRCE